MHLLHVIVINKRAFHEPGTELSAGDSVLSKTNIAVLLELYLGTETDVQRPIM